MQRMILSLAAGLSCLLLSSATVLAQSHTASAYNIPFSFSASGVQMASGYYTMTAPGVGYKILQGARQSIFVQNAPQLDAKPRAAHLVFHKYGNSYFLSEVWDENGRGTRMNPTLQERQLERKLTLAEARPQTVSIVAAE